MTLIDWHALRLDGDKAYCDALRVLESHVEAHNAELDGLRAAVRQLADRQTHLRGLRGPVSAPVTPEPAPTAPEPDPVPNEHPAVWDLVIADMQQRDADGRAKYGTPLQPFNGRRALTDAYQEALDLTVYLRQALYEQAQPANATDVTLSRVAYDVLLGALAEQREQIEQLNAQLGNLAATAVERADELGALRKEVARLRLKLAHRAAKDGCDADHDAAAPAWQCTATQQAGSATLRCILEKGHADAHSYYIVA